MQDTTKTILISAFNSDPTRTDEEQALFNKLLKGAAGRSKLLTTKQAAEFLNVHPVTLRGWAGKPGFPSPVRYTVRKIRWKEDQLLEFQQNGKVITDDQI